MVSAPSEILKGYDEGMFHCDKKPHRSSSDLAGDTHAKSLVFMPNSLPNAGYLNVFYRR